MAKREINRLKAVSVAKAMPPGYHPDGAGLYLQVSPSGAKSWVFRYMRQGKQREMGLGSYQGVTLAQARQKASDARTILASHEDPLDLRQKALTKSRLSAATARSFESCATEFIASQRAGWKSEKHGTQWLSTLKTYAFPIIGPLPVSAIDTGLVLQVLEPIWTTKTETANRVRGRIESVLSWATARGFRSGDNPARWRGHLDAALPSPKKVKKVVHFPALPYSEIRAFMTELGKGESQSRLALQLLILTACRTSELIGARWGEIDFEKATWTIPGERMKAGIEHRVPLSTQALAIFNQLAGKRLGDFVFPGQRNRKTMSNMAMLELLKGMGRGDITAHGFRSTFRDWAAEETNFPNHVVEMALAHTIGDKTEAAYRRGELFSKRAKLMQAWADFATPC